MRFFMFLIVALTLTLAWQSSVIAAVSGDQSCVAADDSKKEKKKKEGSDDAEPECD